MLQMLVFGTDMKGDAEFGPQGTERIHMHSVFDVFALIVNIKAYVNMPVVYHVQKDRLQLVLLSMDYDLWDLRFV
jgi:hypothetical protein